MRKIGILFIIMMVLTTSIYGGAATAISVVAAIAGASVTNSIVISVATYVIGLVIPNAYYSGYFQTKWEDALKHTRRYTTFYEYSNYTGQIGDTIYVYDIH